jgi:hypothetical protein
MHRNVIVAVGIGGNAATADLGAELVAHHRAAEFAHLPFEQTAQTIEANGDRRHRHSHQPACPLGAVGALAIENAHAERAVVAEQLSPIGAQRVPDLLELYGCV